MALVFYYPATKLTFGHLSACIDERFISWWPDTNKDDKTSLFTLKRVEDQNIYKDTIGEGKHPKILFIKMENELKLNPELNKFEKWHTEYIKHTKNNYHFWYSNCVEAVVKALVATGFVKDELKLITPEGVYDWLKSNGALEIKNINEPEGLKVSKIILNLYKCSWEEMLDNSFDLNNFSNQEDIETTNERYKTIVSSAVDVINGFSKIILTILKNEFNPEIKIDFKKFSNLQDEILKYSSSKEVKKLLDKILDKLIYIISFVDKDNRTQFWEKKKDLIEGMTYPDNIAYQIFISLNAYELIEFVRSLLKEIKPQDEPDLIKSILTSGSIGFHVLIENCIPPESEIKDTPGAKLLHAHQSRGTTPDAHQLTGIRPDAHQLMETRLELDKKDFTDFYPDAHQWMRIRPDAHQLTETRLEQDKKDFTDFYRILTEKQLQPISTTTPLLNSFLTPSPLESTPSPLESTPSPLQLNCSIPFQQH